MGIRESIPTSNAGNDNQQNRKEEEQLDKREFTAKDEPKSTKYKAILIALLVLLPIVGSIVLYSITDFVTFQVLGFKLLIVTIVAEIALYGFIISKVKKWVKLIIYTILVACVILTTGNELLDIFYDDSIVESAVIATREADFRYGHNEWVTLRFSDPVDLEPDTAYRIEGNAKVGESYTVRVYRRSKVCVILEP